MSQCACEAVDRHLLAGERAKARIHSQSPKPGPSGCKGGRGRARKEPAERGKKDRRTACCCCCAAHTISSKAVTSYVSAAETPPARSAGRAANSSTARRQLAMARDKMSCSAEADKERETLPAKAVDNYQWFASSAQD